MSSFMLSWPPAARFALAVAITVGITLLAVKLLRKQILELDTKDDVDDEARDAVVRAGREADPPEPPPPPLPPPTTYLAQRVIGMTTSAFVFLLAFTLSSYWGTTKDARSYTLTEATYWAQALALSQKLPADEGREQVQSALLAYRDSIVGPQWDSMQRADTESVQQLQIDAGTKVGEALLTADRLGATKAPSWPQLASAADDMLMEGRSRLSAMPNPSAPGVLIMIGVLGIINLALTVAFQASRMGTNMFLAGAMAAITALLMFVVVETSNAYVGGASVNRPQIFTENIDPRVR